MSTPIRWLLSAALSTALQGPAAGADCKQLSLQREHQAAQAMQAELVLIHELRQRICPKQEALASATDLAAPSELDLAAYIRCRREAEAELQRSKPVLYTNRNGFTFYTPAGAQRAAAADTLLEAMKQESCRAASPTPGSPGGF